MGQLVDGKWQDVWYDTKATGGAFVRTTTAFRNWITPDGEFAPESGRYHLYVSLACPWAHRTLIFRKLKGLEAHISVSVVHPHMLEHGWTFARDFAGATGDDLFGFDYMHQVYTKADPTISGRVTVPVLWDKQTGKIVSNESAEIIRMFNSAFNALTGNTLDFAPQGLLPQIDAMNAKLYDSVNNGVYKAGFATSQSAYETAIEPLFETLDWLEAHLSQNRYLVGDQITEADWRLFTTLVRFDAVYHTHFKCNRKLIQQYPALTGWLRELYQVEGVAETVDLEHIRQHYFFSHTMINPTQVVPAGPAHGFDLPHDRAMLSA